MPRLGSPAALLGETTPAGVVPRPERSFAPTGCARPENLGTAIVGSVRTTGKRRWRGGAIRGTIGPVVAPERGFAVRHVLAALVVSLSGVLIAPAAPVPKHLMKAPVCYFPTTPGAKWVYDEAGSESVFVASAVEERKGTKVVTVERDDRSGRVAEEVMEVSATGTVRTHGRSGVLDAPLEILRVPFRVGDVWAFKSGGLEGTKTVVAVETIKVPAGTFEAVCVDTAYTFGGQKRQSTAWYAPNVGIVKVIQQDTNSTRVLKSFVPGKL